MSILMTEYDYATDLAVQREDAYEDGWEQGAYQKAVETARNLLSMGLSLEQVARCTGLPLETVRQLLQGQ